MNEKKLQAGQEQPLVETTVMIARGSKESIFVYTPAKLPPPAWKLLASQPTIDETPPRPSGKICLPVLVLRDLRTSFFVASTCLSSCLCPKQKDSVLHTTSVFILLWFWLLTDVF